MSRPAFDVASVRENTSGAPAYSSFPLNSGAQYDAKGGLFVARGQRLLQYLVFAYKPDMFQIQQFRAKLPDWAGSVRFDIEARTDGCPTKDEMRLMMQSLLGERFHLKIHTETREVPVYVLQQVHPGTLGPALRPHPADDPDCTKTSMPRAVAGSYPVACGAGAQVDPESPGDMAAVGFDVTPDLLAYNIGGAANITDRRILDETGLTGTFDFRLEFAPDHNETQGPDALSDSVATGASFTKALSQQLGLKLVRQTRAIQILVIDKLEKPAEN